MCKHDKWFTPIKFLSDSSAVGRIDPLDCYNNAVNGHLPFCFASMSNCIFNAINRTTRIPAVENAFIEVIYNNIGDPIGAAIYALTNILANTEIMIEYGEDYIYEDHENDWI